MIGNRPQWVIAVGASMVIGCSSGEAPPPTVAPDLAVRVAGSPERAPAQNAPRAPELPTGATPDAAPPLSGGTLSVSANGAFAVASDAEAGTIFVVNLSSPSVAHTVTVGSEADPGRSIEGPDGRFWVSLRGAGEVLALDPATGRSTRHPVCTAPRGLAWDTEREQLVVACSTGELVRVNPDGEVAHRVMVESDLRDVVAWGNRLLVTTFRRPVGLVLDGEGRVLRRITLPTSSLPATSVGWRMVPDGQGGGWVLHQLAAPTTVPTGTGGYGGTATSACSGAILQPAVTRLNFVSGAQGQMLPARAALAIDVAASLDGARIAVAIPGNTGAQDRTTVQVFDAASRNCVTTPLRAYTPPGEPVAVAWAPNGGLVVQTRAPSAVLLVDRAQAVALGPRRADSPGHRLFHTNTGGTITCAGCHPEGGDDGLTWTFVPIGARRTPTLRVGLSGTEPFHWDGDLRDLPALVQEVMVRRMSAPVPSATEVSSLRGFLDGLRPATPPGNLDLAQVGRGRALFQSEAVGCAGCHSGPSFTNNASVDVGTGGTFQVPTLLGLAWRAPYMHNGCAATLRDRFGACGGGDRHGRTAQLATDQIDDLVAYLGSL